MKRLKFFSLLAAAASVALAFPANGAPASDEQATPAPATNYRPHHKPDKINPVWRSWQFTTGGDALEYRVEGIRDFDRERRYYAGAKDGKHEYVVVRFKSGKEVSKTREAIPFVANTPADAEFARFFEREGYSISFQLRTNNGTPFTCMELENALQGKYMYSEDVPMGGLVYRENYDTGAIMELVAFRRTFEPAPSTLAIWTRSPADLELARDDTIDMGGNVRTGAELGALRGDEAVKVKSGELQIREDADSTPPYFLPRGEKSRDLLKIGYITNSFHLSPRLAVYYTTKRLSKQKPDEEYSVTKKMSVVSYQNAWYLVETAIDVTGNPPEPVKLDVPVVKLFDDKEFSLEKWPAFYQGFTTRELGGAGNVDLNHYMILEGPHIERRPRREGGEIQEVLRRRHDMFVTRDLDPMLGKWQVRERWYFQETDKDGKVLKSNAEESYLIVSRDRRRPLTEQESYENLQAVREFVASSDEVVW